MTRTERTYYVVIALWNLPGWFMHPVYPLFLQSRGLDLFEVGLVFAIFQFSTFLFEVPTGAVADLYGRKASFLLSCLIRMSAFALYAFAAVRYADTWFWIDNRDLSSKYAFFLVTFLFALTDTGGGLGAPVLTIPAG